MKLPDWFVGQMLLWLGTAIPIYVVAALWGGSDWWLIDNIYDSDLAAWEIVLFTLIFFHPLLTFAVVIAHKFRRAKVA